MTEGTKRALEYLRRVNDGPGYAPWGRLALVKRIAAAARVLAGSPFHPALIVQLDCTLDEFSEAVRLLEEEAQ